MAVMTLSSPPHTTKSALPQLNGDKVTATTTKSCRHVSFNKALDVEYENAQWCFEDCRRSWYTAFEYKHIKDCVQTQAKQIWKSERRHAAEESYSKALLRVYDLCCDAKQETDTMLSDDDQAVLTMYVGKANTRSGLERMCIREIAHDKRYRRGEVSAVVMSVQATHQHGVARSRAELLRMSSETVTRPSRLFARHMAVALESSLR